MRQKLRAQVGFTLTELLTATAILSLAVAALCTALSAAVQVYRRATASAEANTLCATLTAAIAGELHFATNPRDRGGALVFDCPTYGSGVALSVRTVGQQEMAAIGDTLLLGPKSYPNGLSVRTELSVKDGFFDLHLAVYDRDGHTWAVSDLTICPLNS